MIPTWNRPRGAKRVILSAALSAKDNKKRRTLPIAETPPVDVAVGQDEVSELAIAVEEVVPVIVQGAEAWEENPDAQLQWQENLDRVKPKIANRMQGAADQMDEYSTYAAAANCRCWQAMFLYSCATMLLTFRAPRTGRTLDSLARDVTKSTRLRQQRFVRLLIQMVNHLSDRDPEAAFKIIPAISACPSNPISPQKLRNHSYAAIDKLAQLVAEALLAQETVEEH
ncbi:hypothetical protein B0A55_12041 [Friedmanniomyces simplex]|uniref:Uncharacterized protein n=1 Tax=Friedmanniomyces simplex TaxID=329884 RepID=A0A4U0WTU8_9PEZI|nr:hypothetical protein B0A55_12041 [Friedmanniomyces simplex]